MRVVFIAVACVLSLLLLLLLSSQLLETPGGIKMQDFMQPESPKRIVASNITVAGIESPHIPQRFADANNAFAADFYNMVSSDKPNIFFSPISMYVAFSLLYEGAGGETAAQLQDAFGFEPDALARHNETAHAISSMNHGGEDATLEMANALWSAIWFTPHDSYLDVSRNTYLATVESVNFTDPEDGVKKINEWANNKTHGRIKKVITEDAVDSLTAMVINNAVYFKGTWVKQFNLGTVERNFYSGTGDTVQVDFMREKTYYKYAAPPNVQILQMRYLGDRMSMLVILPNEDSPELIESVSADMIRQWTSDLQPHHVYVAMPKFTLKTSYDLTKPLPALGAQDVFSPSKSDLFGIGYPDDPRLYVSSATQSAFVNVNEKGTEAAAATTITAQLASEQETHYFTANRPFMFIIQDDESGAILFMGRMSDPSS